MPAEKTLIPRLVRVNLIALAANLSHHYGEEFDELSAARWLTKTTHEGLSPFSLTEDWQVFYCEEDPECWLEPEEIIGVEDAPERRQFTKPGPKAGAVYMARQS